MTTHVCDAALAQPDVFAILTYHPPIFSGLKSLSLSNPLQRSLLRCIAAGVSVYTIHTAADNAIGGVNDYMGSGLLQFAGVETDPDGMCWPSREPSEKSSLAALSPAKDVPEGQEGAGGGRIVRLAESAKGGRALSRNEVVRAVKQRLNLQYRQLHFTTPTRTPMLTYNPLRCASPSCVVPNWRGRNQDGRHLCR